MVRDKKTQSPIGRFRVNDDFYRHVIYCADDDRIECLNAKNEVMLTFTANCMVLDRAKNKIGTLGMKHPSESWEYRQEGQEPIEIGTDLLVGEMKIAKMYLESKLAFKPA